MVSLRQIVTLLDLQRRTIANAFRDRAQHRGLIASVAVSLLWYGFWIAMAALCAVTPNMIGAEDVERALPGLLLFAMVYWQLSPLVTLSLGVSLEMRKLALYPISLPTLFLVECLLRLWTAFEALLVLGGLFLGLMTAGSSSPAALAAGLLLFVAFNMFLSAGVRNLVERVFQKRALREIVLIGMVALAVLPQVLVFSSRARDWMRMAVVNQIEIPYWSTPSGLAARLALAQTSAADVALLGAMIAAAAVFGYLMFRSTCRLTAASTAGEQAPRVSADRKPPRRMAVTRLIPDPLGALLEKEIRYLWRSPRFRLPFFMGFTFGVIAWAPIVLRLEGWLGDWLQTSAPSFITLYALLLLGPVLFLNRFGFDRGAVRFYFWMPVSFEQLLAAKNLSTAGFAYLEMAAIIVVCGAIGLPLGLPQIAEAGAITAVALLYLLSVGNYMSVRFAVPSNPDRISRAGAGHGLRSAVQFFLFPLALTPLLPAFIARYAFQSTAGSVAILAVAAAGGVLLYRLTFRHVAALGFSEREHLLSSLTSGAGPVAAE